jgi:hypothetical protein
VVGGGERALQLALVDGAAAVAVGGPERALDLRVRPQREREVSAASLAVAVPESSRRLRWRRVGAAASLAVAVPGSSRRLRWRRVGAAASLTVPTVVAVDVAVVVSHGGIGEEVAVGGMVVARSRFLFSLVVVLVGLDQGRRRRRSVMNTVSIYAVAVWNLQYLFR